MNDVKMYTVDLTLTDACNFRCKYCFEKDYFNPKRFEKVDLFIQRMNEFMNSEFFKSKYDILNIGFWGGEPTLASDIIKKVVEYYKNDNRVKFFIFSNGYAISKVSDLLYELKDQFVEGGHPKLCIQISYDGMPIHDIYRVRTDGILTSTQVRTTIKWAEDNKIPYVIKSTITPDSLKYLYAAYKDIKELQSRYPGTHFKSQNYFPTVDYYHLDKYTDEQIDQYCRELEQQLVDIATEEVEYYQNTKQFFFAWFVGNKSLCCAGRDMTCVAVDGKIFKCHGSVYDDSQLDHLVTNLDDENFIQHLDSSYKLHDCNFGFQPKECMECDTTYCLRCNPAKYELSDKKTYIDKWRDYPVQNKLCKIFKTNGKIVKALRQIINS